MPIVVIYICAAMLFFCVAPMHYGYYTVLRLVACIVFVGAALIAFERKSKALPWIYGFLALIFNPIIKIYFPKEIWVFIDIAAGVILLVTAKSIKTKSPRL